MAEHLRQPNSINASCTLVLGFDDSVELINASARTLNTVESAARNLVDLVPIRDPIYACEA